MKLIDTTDEEGEGIIFETAGTTFGIIGGLIRSKYKNTTIEIPD